MNAFQSSAFQQTSGFAAFQEPVAVVRAGAAPRWRRQVLSDRELAASHRPDALQQFFNQNKPKKPNIHMDPPFGGRGW